MNILLHHCDFPPQPGGVGSYLFNMACALRAAGHAPVVVTSRVSGQPEYAEEACGPVYRAYDRAEVRSARVCDRVLALAREHRADLIEGADHHGELARLIRAHSRPPVFVKLHGSNPVHVLQASHVLYAWQRLSIRLAHLRNWRQTAAERFSIERADLAAVPSQRLLDELRRQGLRLPARTRVIPNPMPAGAAVASAPASAPTVLLVARLDIGKGVQYLPAIVGRIAQRQPDVTLEIAGGDSYARGLGSVREWLVRQLGPLAGRVRFLGNLDSAGVAAAYARAWVLIVPSCWDNFPTVVLEAMARGLPVVASPHGGMPEMLAGTQCATALPESERFTDLVAALLADSASRRAAGASLRAKAQTVYAPATIARQYVEFVQGG